MLKPIRDGAIVKPEIREEEGGIIFADLFRTGRPSGVLVAVHNPNYEVYVGKRVLIRTGQLISYKGESFWLAKCDQILAVLPDNFNAQVLEDIERCTRCRPSGGEGGMLLDHNGYCIQCGLNKYGEHKRDRKLRVSGDEVERFGKTPRGLIQP